MSWIIVMPFLIGSAAMSEALAQEDFAKWMVESTGPGSMPSCRSIGGQLGIPPEKMPPEMRFRNTSEALSVMKKVASLGKQPDPKCIAFTSTPGSKAIASLECDVYSVYKSGATRTLTSYFSSKEACEKFELETRKVINTPVLQGKAALPAIEAMKKVLKGELAN